MAPLIHLGQTPGPHVPREHAVRRALETMATWLRKVLSRTVYDAGSKGSDFALDARNGVAQKVALSASCSLTGIDNLVGAEVFDLHVDLSAGAFTLTLASAAFDGPDLSLAGTTACVRFADFGTGKITAVADDW